MAVDYTKLKEQQEAQRATSGYSKYGVKIEAGMSNEKIQEFLYQQAMHTPGGDPNAKIDSNNAQSSVYLKNNAKEEPKATGSSSDTKSSGGIASNDSKIESREQKSASERDTGVKSSGGTISKQRTEAESQESKYSSGVRQGKNPANQNTSESANKNSNTHINASSGGASKASKENKEGKREESNHQSTVFNAYKEEHRDDYASHGTHSSQEDKSNQSKPELKEVVHTEEQKPIRQESPTEHAEQHTESAQENKQSLDERRNQQMASIGDSTSMTGYAGLSQEQLAQLEYNRQMRGLSTGSEKNEMDSKIEKQFKGAMNVAMGSVVAGGAGQGSERIESEKNIRVSNDSPKQLGIRTNTAVPAVTGIHCSGGKINGAYKSLNTKADYKDNSNSINEQALSIFANEDIANQCGIKFDPKQRAVFLQNSQVGEVSKTSIAEVLIKNGYTPQAAYQYANEALRTLNQQNGSGVMARSSSGSTEVAIRSDNDSKAITVPAQISGNKQQAIIKAHIINDKFVIYRPMDEKVRRAKVNIERTGSRVSSMNYHYAIGQLQSSSAEAGQGVGNVMQAARVASLIAPQMSIHVNRVLQDEIKRDLKNNVVFKNKSGTMHMSVDEMNKALVQMGFSPELVSQCKIGDDYSGFAKAVLKSDGEGVTADNTLTNEQKDLLQSLSKSASMTKDQKIKSINTVLNKYGITMNGDYGHATVLRLNQELKKATRKYGGIDKIPEEFRNALQEGIKFAKNNTYGNVRSKKLINAAFIAKGQLEKNGAEAGKGLSMNTRAYQVATSTIKLYVQVKWKINILAREAAQKALLFAAKGMLASARAANALHLTKLSKGLEKVGKAGEAGANVFKSANRFANNFTKNAKSKVGGWVREHNPLRFAKKQARRAIRGIGNRIAGSALYRRFMASKLGRVIGGIGRGFGIVGGKIKAVKNALAHLFRAFGFIKHLIRKVLVTAALILILFCIFCILLNSVIGAFTSLFDANGQEYDTKQYLASHLKEYWEDDMNYVFDIKNDLQHGLDDATAQADLDADQVNKVTFIFEDFKHYSASDVAVSHPNEEWMWDFNYEMVADDFESYDYTQSSNNGEIMSMALIRYNWNLGSLKNSWFAADPVPNHQLRDVDEYMKKLYYGSHELVVTVEAQSFASDDVTDGELADSENEWSHVEYEITATYKTYYFNYLFDTNLSDEPRRTCTFIMEEDSIDKIGSEVGFVDGWDSIYYALRQEGISHNGAAGVMSNLAHESADRHNWQAAPPNPTAGKPSGTGPYGICQWTSSGDRKANMISWCQSKGYDYTSTSGQLAYMIYEINNKNELKPTKNYIYSSSYSPYEMANKFADNFERYGGGEEASRGNLAETIAAYYDKYKNATDEELSELYNTGQKIADIATKSIGKIHYTQGTGDYVGTRETSLSAAYAGFSEDPASSPPTAGMDCSSFAYGCYSEAGISGLPLTSAGYSSLSAKEVPIEQAAPGDVVWKSGHVGICVGGGKAVALRSCFFYKTGKYHEDDCSVDCYTSNVSSFTKAYRLWK